MFKFLKGIRKKREIDEENLGNTTDKIEMEQEDAGVKIDVLSVEEMEKLGFKEYKWGENTDNLECLVRFTNTETNQVAYVGLKPWVTATDIYDSIGDSSYTVSPARLVLYDNNLKEKYCSTREGNILPNTGTGGCFGGPLSPLCSHIEYKKMVEESCNKLENSAYKGFLVRAIKAMAVEKYNRRLERRKQYMLEFKEKAEADRKKDMEYRKPDADAYAAFSQRSR